MVKTNSAAGNVVARILSAAVLAPLVLALVYLGTPYFEGLVLIGAVILLWEWFRLCGLVGPQSDGRSRGALVGFGWLVAGLAYVLIPCAALVWLRWQPDGGEIVMWLFVVVWASDIGAYVFGRGFGGPKLAPAISPNKTWSGLGGGIGCAAIVGAGAAWFFESTDPNLSPVGWAALTGGILGLVGQGGDLLESLIKRRFGVKDSGSIIPGHGGLLDRADALVAAAVVLALLALTGKGNMLPWQ